MERYSFSYSTILYYYRIHKYSFSHKILMFTHLTWMTWFGSWDLFEVITWMSLTSNFPFIPLQHNSNIINHPNLVPYRPLTFNVFPQKCPFWREPAIFRGGDPSHSILHPPKTPRRVTLSWRPWPWFRHKMPKTWVESFQKKVKLPTFFLFSKRYITAENDSRRLKLGSKCADKSILV